jgi:hypothetical protein
MESKLKKFEPTEESPMTDQHIGKGFRWFIWYAFATLLAMSVLWWAAAYAQAANTATITFSPSTQYTDGTAYPSGAVVSYNLWQGLKGATRVKVGAFSSGGSISTGLLTGSEYCWDVTTVVTIGGVATESAHSVADCKKFDGTPSVVVITVT